MGALAMFGKNKPTLPKNNGLFGKHIHRVVDLDFEGKYIFLGGGWFSHLFVKKIFVNNKLQATPGEIQHVWKHHLK